MFVHYTEERKIRVIAEIRVILNQHARGHNR